MSPITFTEQDKEILARAINETGGYAGSFVESFLSEDTLRSIDINNIPENIALEKEQWLKIFNMINAVVHVLGQEELETVTGYKLADFMTVARKIFCTIYDRYYGDDFKIG